MKRKISKSIILFFILLLLANMLIPIAQAFTQPISSAYLYHTHQTPYMIYYKGQKSHASYVVYNDNGNLYPAFCINDGINGAESGAYSVSVSTFSDNRVWRVMKHGFPYNSASSMGLWSDDEAYYVTKHAIYCVLGQRNVGDYKPMSGYDRVYNSLVNLVNIGLYGAETYQSPTANINKQGDLTKEIIGGTTYYVQNFNVTSTLEFATYNVTTAGCPEGSRTLNTSNTDQGSFTGNQTFKIAIPEDKMTSNINAYVKVDNVIMKTYPIMYGASGSSSRQNYCLASDPYQVGNSLANFRINIPTTEIVKKDRTTGTPLSGAVYEVYKDVNENNLYDEGTDTLVTTTNPTNNEGKTTVTGLIPGKYVAVEKIAPEGYNLDSVHQAFEIRINGETAIVESNDSPSVKIYKTERKTEYTLPNVKDEENYGVKTYLSGAVYEIYKDTNNNNKIDDKDELVFTTESTNDEGKTTVKGLPVGKYISKEIKSPEGYNLDSENQFFEIKQGGEAIILQSNDSVITSKIEITKLAKDDSDITEKKAGEPLENAKFNIYDINHKLLYENLSTDEEGKIDVILRYGKYIVEEVRPPEFYLLNDDKEANTRIINVYKQDEQISLDFEDEAVKLGLVIEKTGIIQCQKNDEIIYNFPQLKNTSNVALDDFTWSDVLPTEYIRATKLYTGTYNEDLDYKFYYKTNLSDDYIWYENTKTEDGTFNTQKNNYIDLSKLNTEDEYVTEWKIEFGTVKAGFEAEEKPFMFAKANDTIVDKDTWTNHTFLTGNYTSIDGKTIPLGSKDDWTTTSYAFSLSIKKLPKTGF